MRILHLETGRHLYGGARQVGYLIDALAARGVDNLLVCPPDHALAGRVRARVFGRRVAGDLDLSLQPRLARLVRDEAPDLVHVHSRRGADTFGGRAAASAGVRSVLTRRVQSPEPAAWLRFKCRPYSSIAVISRAVRTELERAGVDATRLRLIPSAVDTVMFRPDPAARAGLIERYGLPADALIAGSAAQFVARKGLATLLPLTECLAAIESRFRLLMFGAGRDRARLERDVRRRGLGRRIIFCGFRPDWPALVPGLDVFVHPARREGLGVAVLEAMSAGRPVVASAVGGIVDVIADGTDGLLVRPGADDDWFLAMRRVLGDASLRASLGDAARRTVEARFTIERMTDGYLALYDDVLRHAGRGA